MEQTKYEEEDEDDDDDDGKPGNVKEQRITTFQKSCFSSHHIQNAVNFFCGLFYELFHKLFFLFEKTHENL